MRHALLIISLSVLCADCTTTRPRPPLEPLLGTVPTLSVASLSELPESLPRPTLLQRLKQKVTGTTAKTSTQVKTGKFKNTGTLTIIHQTGTGNVAMPTTITKPSAPVATGDSSTATDNRKSDQRDQRKDKSVEKVKEKPDNSTSTGLASGHVVAGIVVVLVLVGILFLVRSRLKK